MFIDKKIRNLEVQMEVSSSMIKFFHIAFILNCLIDGFLRYMKEEKMEEMEKERGKKGGHRKK